MRAGVRDEKMEGKLHFFSFEPRTVALTVMLEGRSSPFTDCCHHTASVGAHAALREREGLGYLRK